MQLWTFLHILAMFAGVTVLIGAELFVTFAIRRRDLGALRAYFRIADRVDKAGNAAFGLGIVFGLIAAIVGGFDLLQGWLILAYVLVAAAIVAGASTVPYLKRLDAALEASDGDEPGPELTALLASPVPLAASTVSAVIIALVIWDMVFKPGF